jgi:hypothetical protein
MSRPITPPYDDRRDKVYKVQVGSRKEEIAVDRLKPHVGAKPTDVAVPPKHGRNG